MSHISFIVCCHGFGHFKRVTAVVKEMLTLTREFKVLIFCQTWQIELTKNWPGTNQLLHNSNVSFRTTPMKEAPCWNKSDDVNNYYTWKESLGRDYDLITSRVIVSDNYAAPVFYFRDTIIMGSFLWHDILAEDNYFSSIASEERQLVKAVKPRIVCLKDMMMPEVRESATPIFMPWFCERVKNVAPKVMSGRVLITGGGTPSNDETLLQLVEQFVVSGEFQIFLDSKLFVKTPDKFVSRVSKFSFTDDDFVKLDLIICRPGIGIVTDSVRYGVPIISLGEKTNKEVVYNSKRIEELGIGIDVSDKAVDEMTKEVQNVFNSNMLATFQNNLRKLEVGGAKKAAEYILSELI